MRRILWPSGSSSDPYSHPPSCLPQAAPGCSSTVVSSVAVVALSLSFFYGPVLFPSSPMALLSLLLLLLSGAVVALSVSFSFYSVILSPSSSTISSSRVVALLSLITSDNTINTIHAHDLVSTLVGGENATKDETFACTGTTIRAV
jgi:hypothetical protein